MAKKKTLKKPLRKVARMASASVKRRLLTNRVRELETKIAGYVPRVQLKSTMGRYRAAMGKLNSEHNRVKLLQSRVHNLESKIEELERKSVAAKTASS